MGAINGILMGVYAVVNGGFTMLNLNTLLRPLIIISIAPVVHIFMMVLTGLFHFIFKRYVVCKHTTHFYFK